jgi:hypothetical protein
MRRAIPFAVVAGVLLSIAATGEAQVTVAQHTGFRGTSASFGVGSYNMASMQARGILNDWISSVRVAPGFSVTLFADDNFGGASIVKTADDSSLVNDGWNDRASSMRVTSGPGNGGPGTVVYTQNGHTLTLVTRGGNVTQATKDRIVQTFFSGYVQQRARFNTSAPSSVTLTIDPNYGGVAATSGARVTCSASFLAAHPWDADGCGTHEFMHVAQAYTSGNNPGWAVEGLADYARFRYGLYNSQAGWSLPAFSSSQHYTNAYRVTARFFVWLENRVRSTILLELDDAMKSGSYSPSFWTFRTGFTVDQLWAQYSANPTL